MNGTAGLFKCTGTRGVLDIPLFYTGFKAWARYWATGQLPANGRSHGGFAVPGDDYNADEDSVECEVRVGFRSEMLILESE